jgi:thioredoxin 1
LDRQPLAFVVGQIEDMMELLMADVPQIDDETFESQVLKSESPVMVDFGAEWCHPCRQLDIIVEELVEEWHGKIKILKLDIDGNVDTTMRYGVMGVPTLILFAGGEEKERLVGLQSKKRIQAKFEPYLAQ